MTDIDTTQPGWFTRLREQEGPYREVPVSLLTALVEAENAFLVAFESDMGDTAGQENDLRAATIALVDWLMPDGYRLARAQKAKS